MDLARLLCGLRHQNAECIELFPVPLPLPTFFSQSLTVFVSCVPPVACPGLDSAAVIERYNGGKGNGTGAEAALLTLVEAVLDGSMWAVRTHHPGFDCFLGPRKGTAWEMGGGRGACTPLVC